MMQPRAASRPDRAAGRLMRLLVAAWLLLVALPSAQAGQGFSLALPLPSKQPVAGLTLVFDCTWANGASYLPIRVTANQSPPSPVDRQLAIEITNENYGERRPVVVTDTITLPAGATAVTKVVSFPRCSANDVVSFSVWEKGVFLEDLSFESRSMFSTGAGQDTSAAILFVTSAQLDVSQFDFMTNASAYLNQQSFGTTPPATPVVTPNSTAISQVAPFTSLPAAELFEGWINYSGLDVIFISQADLEHLATTRPKVFESLRDWTRCGGNLCVFGVGKDWHGLPPLRERLTIDASPKENEQPKSGWTLPDSAIYMQQLQQPGGATVYIDPDAQTGQPTASKPSPVPTPTFVWRHAGLGTVVAIAADNPFPGDAMEWKFMLNTLGPGRWRWESRYGLSINDGNPSFDGFTIADVGLPPVKTYRVLITLFVVGIGPLNYWLLRRKGRLHLLLFTVPAAAIMVSLALLAYAVIADGFDTYLRSYSFTRLDQERNEAVSLARLSYYAGLAPSGGLHFGADTAVLPIDRDSYWQRSVHQLRRVNWTPEQQLVRGWVPSRTPVQYLTARPYACQRELRVLERQGELTCAVENRLDTRIDYLMLRDANGGLYFGHDIARGGRATLEALDSDAKIQRATAEMLQQRYRGQLDSNVAAPSSMSRALLGGARRYSQYSANQHLDGGSLLETQVTAAFEEIGSQLKTPRSYVAVTGRPPDVTVGVDALIERQSLHVIVGTW